MLTKSLGRILPDQPTEISNQLGVNSSGKRGKQKDIGNFFLPQTANLPTSSPTQKKPGKWY
jgi:hypothetical protein